MTTNRLAYGSFRENELIYFSKGCGNDELLTNMTFFSKLENGLKVKIKYFHNEYNNRELGLFVTIINPFTGNVMDEMLLRFDACVWRSKSTDYVQIGSDGWAVDITEAERKKIRKMVQDYIAFWAK